MAYDIFDVRGTQQQKDLVYKALQRTNFPWELLKPKLWATKYKRKIPVEWADLTMYGAVASKAVKAEVPQDNPADGPLNVLREANEDREEDTQEKTYTWKGKEVSAKQYAHYTRNKKSEVDDHEHEELRGHGDQIGHVHIEYNGDKAHGIEYRHKVLGLAWYSGKVSLDITLINDPELAQEVFLSEGAHMVDFFWMTPTQRQDIFNAFHGSTTNPPDHNHSWFDVGPYNTWVGEAFMGGFIKAFSNIQVSIPFVHEPTPYVAARIRDILKSEPTAPTAPTNDAYFSTAAYSWFFHRNHAYLPRRVIYDNRDAAVNTGKRPCPFCKP